MAGHDRESDKNAMELAVSIQLPELPYALDALEPQISRRTLEFHYGKHHRGYVNKLNAAIVDTDYAGKSLEQIVLESHKAADNAVFDNAAQVWNHTFLWNSMTPDGPLEPSGALADAMQSSFGDHDGFRAKFKESALGQFGSGWTWLVSSSDGLEIVSTGNAETPITDGLTPLLTLDVWEHAYYLDYQNGRDRYAGAFIDALAYWDFAEANLVKVLR